MPCYQSDTIEHNGKKYVVELWRDEDMGPPWKEHDGHGVVSDWTGRAKAPGELVLAEDRGMRRYYDFAESVQIAKRDGWDTPPYDKADSPGRKAAKAARADYEYLRRWCNDDWHWCGVVVRPAEACACCGPKESLWGIESDCRDYLHEVAIELIEQLEQTD